MTICDATQANGSDLETPFDDRRLLATINAARAGHGYRRSDSTTAEAVRQIAALSRRERQVLEGIVAGQPTKVVAQDLAISIRTAEVHRARMLDRLGTRTTAGAIRLAVLATSSSAKAGMSRPPRLHRKHDRVSDAGNPRTMSKDRSINLDNILITSELLARGPRRSDLPRAGASALEELAQQRVEYPSDVLSRFAELARQFCHAGSAGISVFEPQPDGTGIFRWGSLTGTAAPFGGETTPRDFSACCMCLDKAEAILMDRPGRCYEWFNRPSSPVVEALLEPLFVGGCHPLGALWLMSHDDKQFDQGDASTLTQMAAVLNLTLTMISDIACRDAALEQAEATLHRSSKLTALGQLAGEVAHDLNNLLTVLSGQLEKEADRDRRQRSRQNIRGQHRKDDGEAERR